MQWSAFATELSAYSEQEIAQINAAFLAGEKAHKGQKRKSGEPYFVHPIQTALTLIQLHADVPTIIAALLHDCPEDTDLSLASINKQFGDEVAQLVDGVTKIVPADLQNSPNTNERTETIRKMMVLMDKDVRIMVIKLADRLHNMQTIEFMKPNRQLSYAQETLGFFVPIADRLCMQDIRDQLANLSISVLQPESAKHIDGFIEQYQVKSEQLVQQLRQSIERELPTITVDVYPEKRSYKKWLKYLEDGRESITSVALVFVCESATDCYQLLGALHQQFPREQLSFQDFINSPSNNGYRGLHTTIMTGEGLRVRCKIRTKEMERYAHVGITTQCFDNSSEGVSVYLGWTKQISPLDSETKNRSDEFWQTLESDILGESLIVHGEDDQVVSIPEQATILDALFYLYGDEVLYVKDVFADNKLVFFWQPAATGMRLTMQTVKHKTVSVEWLQIVHTATASSLIKHSLKKQNKDTKITIGKSLLQAELSLHNFGFLEEFLLRQPKGKAKQLDDQVFIEIAEGSRKAEEVYLEYFIGDEEHDSKLGSSKTTNTLTISSNDTQTDENTILDRLLPHEVVVNEYSYKKTDRGFTATIKMSGNAEQIRNAEKTLLTLEKTSVRNVTGTVWFGLTACILIGLWTADVIFAKQILAPAFSFVDITITRFITLCIFACGLLLFQKYNYRKKIRLKRLNPLNKKLLSSSLALFSTGLCTYIALTELTSTEYAALVNIATIIAFSTAVKRTVIDDAIIIVLFTFSLIPILFFSNASALGITAGLGTAASFLVYSYYTKRYQTEQYILSRYPYFIFFMAVGTLLLSMTLLPIATIGTLSVSAIAFLFIYHLLFTSLPYLLYFQFAKRKRIQSIGNLIPFFFPLVMLFDSTVNVAQINWLYVVAFIATIGWIYRRLGLSAES